MSLCPRCLLAEMEKEKPLHLLIREVIDAMPEAERAGNISYAARLSACRACDNLLSGMCRLCGCYVEARAAKARMGCPDTNDQWRDL